MDPILATGALSLAGHLVRNLAAGNAAKKAEMSDAAKVNFSQMLARASKSPQVQQAHFLEGQGITSVTDAQEKLNGLTTQLLQDGDLQNFVGGTTGSISLQVNADDSVTVRTTEGRERTFTLNGDARGIASDIRHITSAVRSATAEGSSSKSAPILRFTPGVGVAF